MLLLFDARYIRTDFHDGISRYSTELSNALAALTNVTFLICDLRQLHFLPDNCRFLLIHSPTSIKEPLTALILNRHRPDVVFSPMQTIGSIGRRFKLIVTSHDMIYFRHKTPPSGLNVVIRLCWRLYHATYLFERIVLNQADMVATVSQTTKAEFLKVKLTKHDIVVIPNAPQQLTRFLPSPPSGEQPPTNLVYMGSFMSYKNVETLIRGLEFLPGFTLHLLSRASDHRKAELQALVQPGSHVIWHNGVTDQVYAQLLATDAMLVTASLDEGYGLPIAEALALGVPAVVSDLPIFHEVAGEGALYFTPDSPRDFADAVLQLQNPQTQRHVITAGKKHISQYSWRTSAKILLRTIKSSLLQ